MLDLLTVHCCCGCCSDCICTCTAHGRICNNLANYKNIAFGTDYSKMNSRNLPSNISLKQNMKISYYELASDNACPEFLYYNFRICYWYEAFYESSSSLAVQACCVGAWQYDSIQRPLCIAMQKLTIDRSNGEYLLSNIIGLVLIHSDILKWHDNDIL